MKLHVSLVLVKSSVLDDSNAGSNLCQTNVDLLGIIDNSLQIARERESLQVAHNPKSLPCLEI
jgi:hypothetical protein